MKSKKFKLQERSGSSMILALVFLLFSVFVGGSVLTAATVNADRIKYESDQQEYLDERSSAYLIVDLLKCDPRKLPQMTAITETVTKTNRVTGEVKKTVGTTIRIPDSDAAPTAMQVMLYQSAVFRYIYETKTDPATISVQHYINENPSLRKINTDLWIGARPAGDPAPELIYTIDHYWAWDSINLTERENCTKCGMQMRETGGKLTGYTFDVTAQCVGGDDLTKYDFDVDFGVKSQLKVHMDASTAKSPTTTETSTEKNAAGQLLDVKTEIENIGIYWDNPVILKGGAGR